MTEANPTNQTTTPVILTGGPGQMLETGIEGVPAISSGNYTPVPTGKVRRLRHVAHQCGMRITTN